jgi:hypothetical protein
MQVPVLLQSIFLKLEEQLKQLQQGGGRELVRLRM